MADDLKVLKLKRNNVKAQLERFKAYLLAIQTSGSIDEQNIAQLEIRLAKLEPSWEEFNAIQIQIEILSGADKDEMPLSEYTERETFEKLFFGLLAEANLKISEFHKQVEAENNTKPIPTQNLEINNDQTTQVKLPIIKLPSFGGYYNQWLEFRDSFRALVHDNQKIAEIQKFYYLKSSLEGEASHIIQSLTVSVRTTLLHLSNDTETQHAQTQDVNTRVAQNNPPAETNTTSVLHSLDGNSISQVILSTALLLIHDKNGCTHTVRALLDCASQSTLITSDICTRLKLNKTKTKTTIAGVNQTKSKVDYTTEIQISSVDKSFTTSVRALIVPKITEDLPSITFDYSCFNLPKEINLADPTFNKSGSIDILLGANIYWDLLCEGTLQLGNNKPSLQSTQLGWVIGGNLSCKGPQPNVYITCFSLETLNNNVIKFWEIENYYSSKPLLSPDENYCEEYFNQTFERNEQGRFIVDVPYKDNLRNLGESRECALKRLYTLENKLERNSELKQCYDAFLREYLKLGHMTKIAEPEFESRVVCYLPHHAVVKETSLTTKVRVVFDASSKTTSGLSLNETQFIGPVVQSELTSILISFRSHTYVLTGDIAMMYRQILIKPEQRCLQRILWRFKKTDNVDCFELNTITYGTASAPYLATRCLEQIAREQESVKPEISKVIRKHTYMDDVLTGHDTTEGLLKLQHDLSKVFAASGFELRQWQTNVPDLINKFELSNDTLNSNIIDLSNNQTSKTLGIYWDSHEDIIKYTIKSHNIGIIITKRVILSEVSQLFDPLGLLAPVIITAKLLIQKLWQYKIAWDEPVSIEIKSQWLQFSKQIVQIVKLSIPRHVTDGDAIWYEIHAFSDASEMAFGGCVYVRTKTYSKGYVTKLLCAKSRVAPLKKTTIPRLELCAAQLLANLVKRVNDSLDIKFKGIYYWSDSTITLCWIMGTPNRWKTFVGNRVSEIQTLTDINNWHHVKSADNPADLISRGMTTHDLINSKFWFEGPAWLADDESLWPRSNFSTESMTNIPEIRNNTRTLVVRENAFELFSRYSTFLKLQRVTAYIYRFYHNCKQKLESRMLGPLTADELRFSRDALIRHAQRDQLCLDYEHLLKYGFLHKKSKLLPLNAFLDDKKLIRVGGRIRHAKLNYNKIHPIILPSNHNLTKLYLQHEHKRLGHCGPQQLLANVREWFWPIQGRNLCKRVVKECIPCFREKPKISEQLMGDLPKVRISQAPPFFNTGLDYAGPLLIRDKKSRGYKLIKVYICLFICLATKAVHIEIVTDLSAEAFIAVLRRFTARRGNPKNIYSDNGLNFVGANREIKELYEFLQTETGKNNIVNHLSKDYITWHFIPPRAPNFGGIWEANIKSVKIHLKRIIGNAYLTYEELTTVLTQIESILNSRPLVPMSNNPDDLDVLTPAHFLIGRRLISVPDPNLIDTADSKLSRFQYLQKLQQQFWQRWSAEYLVELQRRYKWQRSQPNIQVGSLVLLRDDNLPPLRWALGRVTVLHPGPDELTRVVTVKTQTSEVKRALSKVCVLPFEGNISVNHIKTE